MVSKNRRSSTKLKFMKGNFRIEGHETFAKATQTEFGIIAIARIAMIMIAAGFWICPGLLQRSVPASAAPGVAQSARRRPAKPKKVPETPKQQPMPFRTGEILNYRVAWAAFSNAATVQLSVPRASRSLWF